MPLQSPRIRCPACGNSVEYEKYPWRCACGEPYNLDGKASLDFKEIQSAAQDLWRYRDVYPLKDIPPRIRKVGTFTDLSTFELDGHLVHIKHEYQLPSGSFKDRGAVVLAAHVHELGIGEVAEDTSGNAGIALSYYAGKLGITCHIYSTTTIKPAKEKKITGYGAILHKVSPDRQAVTEETLKRVKAKYYASHIYNPYFIHGTKSLAYEIYEQLGYEIPEAVIVPVGNGTLILGLELGFRELREMGISRGMPRLIGVQAAARCPVVSSFAPSIPESNGEINLADGIDVARPPRIRQILSAVKETKGGVIAVSNEEIEGEMPIRKILGVTIEPTSLVALAGARKYLQYAKDNGKVVIPLSGANC